MRTVWRRNRAFLIGALFICLMATGVALAKHKHPESYYRDLWCTEKGGAIEVQLEDGTRCDCITDTHAVEIGFANTWAESLGQALHYSTQTGKRAGIVLILEKESDQLYLDRLKTIIKSHALAVDVWDKTDGD